MVLEYSKLQTHLSFGAQMQSKWTFGKALISPTTSFHDQSEFIAFSQFSEYLTRSFNKRRRWEIYAQHNGQHIGHYEMLSIM